MTKFKADEIAQAVAKNRAPSEVHIYMRVGSGQDNLPHDEVATDFIGQDGTPLGNKDIIIYPGGGYLQNIPTLSANTLFL